MKRGIVTGLIAGFAGLTPLMTFATTNKPHSSWSVQTRRLLRSAPKKDVTDLERALREFAEPIKLPTKLPFVVTRVTESLLLGSSSSTIHIDFDNRSTKQSMLESVVYSANTSTLSFMFNAKAVTLAHGMKGYASVNSKSNQLTWFTSPDEYTLESHKDGKGPMLALRVLETIANTMR